MTERKKDIRNQKAKLHDPFLPPAGQPSGVFRHLGARLSRGFACTDPQHRVCLSCWDLDSASVLRELPCPPSGCGLAGPPRAGARGAEHGESTAAQPTGVARGKPGRQGRCVHAPRPAHTHSACGGDAQMPPGPSRVPEDLLHLRLASDSADTKGGGWAEGEFSVPVSPVFHPRPPPLPNQLRAA